MAPPNSRANSQALQQYPDGTLIIRTSWVYSEFGNNFVRTMIRLMKERPAISVVNDQIGSPTYAADLATAILHIINYPTFTTGLFHYSNEGRISWYEFALAIRDAIGSPCIVNPIPTSQYPTPAKRPHYSLLDKTRIRDTYGVSIPRMALQPPYLPPETRHPQPLDLSGCSPLLSSETLTIFSCYSTPD